MFKMFSFITMSSMPRLYSSVFFFRTYKVILQWLWMGWAKYCILLVWPVPVCWVPFQLYIDHIHFQWNFEKWIKYYALRGDYYKIEGHGSLAHASPNKNFELMCQ